MSTTVTYKGATLTTVDNQTKTLQTAGTWMEGDLTLTDVSGGGTDNQYKLAAGTITDADIDWSQVTALRRGSYEKCTALTRVANPTVPHLQEFAFRYCTGLTAFEISATSNNQQYCADMLRYNTELLTATIHFTATSTISFTGNYAFSGCTKLHTIILDVPNNKQLNWNATWMCYGSNALRNLVLKNNAMVALTAGWSANGMGGIYDNPTASKIYVPQSLISSYQTASNWSSAYSAGVTFAPIEGSEYEL